MGRRRRRLGRPATAPPPPTTTTSGHLPIGEEGERREHFALKKEKREKEKKEMRKKWVSTLLYLFWPDPRSLGQTSPNPKSIGPHARLLPSFFFYFSHPPFTVCTPPPAFIFFFTRIMFIVFTHLYSYYIFFFDAF